jgi:hypothetical protein
MAAVGKPNDFKATAVDARHCCLLIEAAVETTASIDRLLHATLQRFAAGEAFHKADAYRFSLMIGAIRQTLEC